VSLQYTTEDKNVSCESWSQAATARRSGRGWNPLPDTGKPHWSALLGNSLQRAWPVRPGIHSGAAWERTEVRGTCVMQVIFRFADSLTSIVEGGDNYRPEQVNSILW